MIPNSAPMAAVFCEGNRLYSRPVAAWGDGGRALIPVSNGRLVLAQDALDVKFLGLWQRGWSPSQDDMATLLPEHTPGVPPLPTVHVTIYQTSGTAAGPGVWEARPTDDGFTFVDDADSLAQLQEKLFARGGFTVDAVRLLGEY